MHDEDGNHELADKVLGVGHPESWPFMGETFVLYKYAGSG